MADPQKLELALANLEKLAARAALELALLRRDRKLDDLAKEMPALEAAKLNSSLGYLANCLYKSSPGSPAYMKVNGLEEADHKIFAEIERNRCFIKKIRDLEAPDADAPGAQPQKQLKVDTAAAMRLARPHLRAPEPPEPAGRPPQAELRKLNKGSILPKRDHLNWRQELQRLQE
jgi:hypothetical protein